MFTSIIKDAVSGLISSVGETADRFIRTKEEKDAFKLKLLELQNNQTLAIIQKISEAEEEITKRHQSDMMSDSWLSKNVRPLVLVYLLTAFTLFSIGSISFDINPEYVKMLKEMLKLAFGFYFGGRSLEKIVSMIKKE